LENQPEDWEEVVSGVLLKAQENVRHETNIVVRANTEGPQECQRRKETFNDASLNICSKCCTLGHKQLLK
jgi:hypothetical protein